MDAIWSPDVRLMLRTSEIVWSRSPDAGIKFLAGRFAGATAANKPGTPRRARISRKTIAQGVPGVSAALWSLACAMCTSLARKARGCGQHPALPAPSRWRATMTMHHSGKSCRENVDVCP